MALNSLPQYMKDVLKFDIKEVRGYITAAILVATKKEHNYYSQRVLDNLC